LLLTFCVGYASAQSEIPAEDSQMEMLSPNRPKPFEKGTLFVPDGTQSVSEHQYFEQLGWIRGSLIFDGRTFHEVDLAYNIYEDLVLVLNLKMEVEGVKALKIDQTKVDGFILNERRFVRHTKMTDPPIASGFYEEYFAGRNLSFYIKHSKAKYIESEGPEYPLQNTMYLLMSGDYFEVQSKKTLLALFPDHKKEIKQYIKQHARRFRKRNIEGLSMVLSYCDELIK